MSEQAHFSEERFLRLADGRSLTQDEDAHLQNCSDCRERLASEQALNSLLGQMEPPTGALDEAAFVAATVQRFEAVRARQKAYVLPLAACGVALFGSFLSLLFAVSFARRIPQVIMTGVDLAVDALKTAHAADIVVSSVPGLSVLCTVAFFVAMVGWAMVFVRWFKVSEQLRPSLVAK